VSLEAHHKFILDMVARQDAIARKYVAEIEAENARLKAEVERLAREQRLKAIPVEAQLLDRIKELKAEVERLKGIILAQSSEFVCNATKREAEPLPDGWNSSIAKACDLLAEKEKEIARLKAEVERLKNNCDYLDQKLDEELAKRGKQS
jgi:uncharacterized small protein (DUF1192 family)